MQVARNASILVAFGLAFCGAMAGGVRLLPNVRQHAGGTRGSGKLTSTPVSMPTTTSVSPPAPCALVQFRRVRYTHRDGGSQRLDELSLA
jgi:hypothetical protein